MNQFFLGWIKRAESIVSGTEILGTTDIEVQTGNMEEVHLIFKKPIEGFLMTDPANIIRRIGYIVSHEINGAAFFDLLVQAEKLVRVEFFKVVRRGRKHFLSILRAVGIAIKYEKRGLQNGRGHIRL